MNVFIIHQYCLTNQWLMVCPVGLASARYLRAVIPGREIRNTASSSTRAAVTHLASRETQAGCSSSNTGSSCCSCSGCSSGSCSLRPNLTNAVHTKKVRCLAEPTMFRLVTVCPSIHYLLAEVVSLPCYLGWETEAAIAAGPNSLSNIS